MHPPPTTPFKFAQRHADLARLLAGTLCALFVLPSAAGESGDAQRAAEENERAKLEVYRTTPALEQKIFVRMAAPKKGEWLSIYLERPQTFGQYFLKTPVRPTKKRRTIVLQPLGPFDKEQKDILKAMKEYAEKFFQLPVRIEAPLKLPSKDDPKKLVRILPLGRRHGIRDRQYDASGILTTILANRVPKDAVVYLGITMGDLWVDQLAFVFGLGSFSNRTGVYSLCRYFPEFWGRERQPGDKELALLRSCKILNHETGHMFGLSHCVFYQCSMNGLNSLPETDVAPVHYCPVCHKKLSWNIQFKDKKRFQALEKFYSNHGLKKQARWMAGRARNWEKLQAEKAELARAGKEKQDED